MLLGFWVGSMVEAGMVVLDVGIDSWFMVSLERRKKDEALGKEKKNQKLFVGSDTMLQFRIT